MVDCCEDYAQYMIWLFPVYIFFIPSVSLWGMLQKNEEAEQKNFNKK